MSELKCEVICKSCGGYGVEVYPDNIKIEMSLCICTDCGHSGTLNEFTLEICD
ncbi:hypothetical protein [Clostridium sp.]|uniref:hypothetical protein n=1 Tax=Clostridium sp. TaxID=1506 RepID=UPI003F387037